MRASSNLPAIIALALLVAIGGLVLTIKPGPRNAERSAAVLIGGPFKLLGPDNIPITDKSFPGKWLLVFFGYTYCPDVCPATMINIADAIDALGPYAKQIQPLFITVDPARDTPSVLKDYTAHFGPHIIGLSGSANAIADVLKAYRVYAAARPAESGGPVLFDHSAIIYLMAPTGAYATHFNPSMTGKEMAAKIIEQIRAEAKP